VTEACEKALGLDHPDIEPALANLAALYDNEGHYAEAEPLFKRSVAIREAAGGPGPEARRRGVPPSLRANGSRECAPDDRLPEAIQRHEKELDCVVAKAPRNEGRVSR
jgi:hypothetical protein